MDTIFLTATNTLFNFPGVTGRRIPQRVKFAAKQDPNFDKWDLMELKFGKLLGEDPKLTLAKVSFISLHLPMFYFYVLT